MGAADDVGTTTMTAAATVDIASLPVTTTADEKANEQLLDILALADVVIAADATTGSQLASDAQDGKLFCRENLPSAVPVPDLITRKEAELLEFYVISLDDESDYSDAKSGGDTLSSEAGALAKAAAKLAHPLEKISRNCEVDVASTSSVELRRKRHAKRMNTLKLLAISCVLTCITNFPSAFMHTSVNTAFQELKDYLQNSYVAVRGIESFSESGMSVLHSAILSCWYAGQIFGALFSPYIIDKYGRKPAYLLATGMMTLACAFQTLATVYPYPEILIVGRILASMFSPMSDTAAILYLQEIAPAKLRGSLSSLFVTGYSAMALLGVVFGMRSVFGHSLTLLFSVPILPGMLSMLFLVWLPETPKFLCIKNRRKEAFNSLNFYQGGIPSDKHALLDMFEQEAKDETADNTTFMSLFRITHLRRALILSLMSMVPTWAFFPILQNSTKLFQTIKIANHFAQISSTVMMVMLVACCVTAAFLLDHWPRRALLIVFGALSAVCVVAFAIFAVFVPFCEWLKYGAVAGIFGYIICYGLAVGPISYFLAPELVPIQNRSTMFCVCFSVTSLLIVATNFSTMPLFEAFGPLVMIALFSIPTALSVVYLYIYLPETKDKEINEIVDALRDGPRRRHIDL